MSSSRVEQMKELVSRFPEDPRARYFLAHELMRSKDFSAASEQYEAYLRLDQGDVGSGYKSYGLCLVELGRATEAAEAYRRGIESALAHHHEGLAEEIRMLLEALPA